MKSTLAIKTQIWVVGTSVALSALVAVAYFWQIRPALLRGRQIQSLANMQTIGRFLDRYRETHGNYPKALEEAIPEDRKEFPTRDGFGGAYYYESRKDSFILVSFGAGHRPDGIDYWEHRDGFAPLERVAGEFTADQTLSDRGWLREAGK